MTNRERWTPRAWALGVVVAGALLVASAGCSPDTDSAFPRRGPGVSVIEHWQELQRIEDPLVRTAAMAQFATTLGPEDEPAVRQLATGMFWRHRSIDHLILMNTWSRLDPAAAMKIAAISRASTGMAARADGVREWAGRDPEAVAATVDLGESAVQRALVRGWYASGRPGLADFVLSDATSRGGQNIMASYAEELGYHEGAEGIARWVDSVRARTDVDPIVIVHAHRKGIVEMAVADPEYAIAYCDRHCDQRVSNTARLRLAERLGVLGHAARTLDWLEAAESADAYERGQAASSAFGYLLREDQEAAFDRVESLFARHEGEAWIEPVVQYAITARNRQNPQKSLDWLHLLSDPQDRRDYMIGIARRWIKMDPQAGEKWLESSPLDAAARAEARTPLNYKRMPIQPR